jgi:hypothetical protein
MSKVNRAQVRAARQAEKQSLVQKPSQHKARRKLVGFKKATPRFIVRRKRFRDSGLAKISMWAKRLASRSKPVRRRKPMRRV